MAEQEVKAGQKAAKSLFEKAPVFHYGSAREDITDPKGIAIASVKSEIELSKAFLSDLKKAKDKNPDCAPKDSAIDLGSAAKLLGQELSCIWGDRETGPNGAA